MKVDILAIGAHPDDIELSCCGTLLKHIDMGKTVGLLDLTKGELGSRGTARIRLKEAEAARKMIKALANAIQDRHPDHGRAAELISRACFLSGLKRIKTHWKKEKKAQLHWRPN